MTDATSNFGNGKNLPAVFIIGAYRSGTTWVQGMLAQHPEIVTGPELTLFDRYIGAIDDIFRKEQVDNENTSRWKVGLPVLFTQDEMVAFYNCFAERIYNKLLLDKPSAKIVLDKRPDYAERVDLINRVLPESKMIHVLRDGRDVVASFRRISAVWGFKFESVKTQAARWRQRVIDAREAERLGDRYHEVRFEDLISDSHFQLSQIFDFLGLMHTSEQIESYVSRSQIDIQRRDGYSPSWRSRPGKMHYGEGRTGTWERDFTASEAMEFELAAGDMLRQLGYETDEKWPVTRI